MAELFLILFFVSFICLIVGLIKPSLVLRFLKGDKTRKKVALFFGGGAFLFLILVGITATPTKQPETPTKQQEVKKQLTIEEIEAQLREEGIKLALVAEVTEKNSIKVTATTNLPDGVTLMFSADDDPKIFGMAQDTVLVRGGVATTELYPQGARAGIYEVRVSFTPWQNAEVITDIVGKKGEKIEEIGVTQGVVGEPGVLEITTIKNFTSITVEVVELDKEVQEYINKTQNLIKQGSAIMDKVTKAANDYEAKTITQSQLKSIVTKSSDEIGEIALGMMMITPPSQFQEAHQHLIRGTNLYNSALFELVIFFDTRSSRNLELYLQFMNEGAVEFLLFAEAIK